MESFRYLVIGTRAQNICFVLGRALTFVSALVLIFGFSFVSAQTTYEGSNVPYIHPRSEWLTTPELQNLFNWYPYHPKEPNEVPDYYPVSRIILHDTACNPSRPGCNDESVPTPTIIQNMYRFHAVTRGWGDVGYHYIIDRKGEIWEGRYGGNGVRGAHLYDGKTCQNFNVGSIGITLIGNYYDTPIPEVMRQSLTRLVAWLLTINDIDIQSSPTTQIWTNRKNDEGRCVTDNGGGFTTSYTGSTLLTHRDIEPANSDVRNINLNVIRSDALALIQEFKNYAFQEQGTNSLYEIVQAKLSSLASTTKKIATITKSQLDLLRQELFARKPEPKVAQLPSAPIIPSFPDGTLLRIKGQEDVYLIKNQKRIHISSATLFNGLGLKWQDIKEEDERSVSALAMSEPVVFPDSILLQAQTPDVYYIQNRKRYLISSPEQFKAYSLKWEDIVQIGLKELDRYYPWGGYVKWPDGTILQNQFNKDQVVIVSNGGLQPFKEKITKKTVLNTVTGRELASYQQASLATPTLTLALSQVFETVKNNIGLQNTPSTSDVEKQTSDVVKQIPEPTIKIALCKNRTSIETCAFSSQDSLEILTTDEGIATVKGFEDRPGFNSTLNDNQFRGKVSKTQSSDGKVWLINEISLEGYLKGIAETLGTDTPEYRKALILMARTYTYYYLTQEKRYPDKPFDLTNSSFDQLYRGYSYEQRSNGLGDVVNATRGQIITFQGKPIVAAYSSDSAGVTKNPCPSIFPKYCDASGNLKPEFIYLKGGIADPEGTLHDQAKIKASHGVGVSTTGARRLIELGKTYQEVIKYYYTGVEITKIY